MRVDIDGAQRVDRAPDPHRWSPRATIHESTAAHTTCANQARGPCNAPVPVDQCSSNSLPPVRILHGLARCIKASAEKCGIAGQARKRSTLCCGGRSRSDDGRHTCMPWWRPERCQAQRIGERSDQSVGPRSSRSSALRRVRRRPPSCPRRFRTWRTTHSRRAATWPISITVRPRSLSAELDSREITRNSGCRESRPMTPIRDQFAVRRADGRRVHRHR